MSVAALRDLLRQTPPPALVNLLPVVFPVLYKQEEGSPAQLVVAFLLVWADQPLVLVALHLQVALGFRPVGFQEERRPVLEDEEDQVHRPQVARHRDLEDLRQDLVVPLVARLLVSNRLLAFKVALPDKEEVSHHQDLEAGRRDPSTCLRWMRQSLQHDMLEGVEMTGLFLETQQQAC